MPIPLAMTHATSIDALLEQMLELGASDLHLTVGTAPAFRIRGRLTPAADTAALDPETTRQSLYSILTSEQQKQLELDRQIDFAYSLPGIARFRVNAFFQRGSIGAAFRLVPGKIQTLEELGLPPVLHTLAEKPRGLVLVTGPTGSGKSTTLAAIVDEINRTRHDHILTIEDPIEFLHRHQNCIVNQREIGTDARSFAEGLRAALRQDPDVLLVGEMRDLETISTALTAAETGHLVFGTLHTQTASSTIDRVIDVFPPAQQQQVRIMLANSLQAVVTQTLLPTLDGSGRVAALEVLLPDDGVRNLVRQAKVEQVYTVMQTSSSRGMQTMEQALADLVLRQIVDFEEALARTTRVEQLHGILERAGVVVGAERCPDRGPGRQRTPTRTPIPTATRPSGWPPREPQVAQEGDPLAEASRRRKVRRASRRPSARFRSCPRSRGRRCRASPCRSSRPRRSRRCGHGKVDRVVGLKIGGSQIAAACISNNGSAKLERIARVPLASGIVSGGELRDIQALADALRTFFEDNDLPRKGVQLGVASSRIGVRSVELPAIDDEDQFMNAIRFRAQEALPIPLDEAVLDYRVLGEREAEGGHLLRRVLLVVAHRELVERYVEACRLAGLTLSGIDLEAFALLRALAPPADRDESAIVAVSIGHDRTTLAVSDGRVCEFTRVLEWGGAELNAGLAQALDMSEAEVDSVKRNLSFVDGDVPDGLEPAQAAAALEALHHGIESLVRELVSSLTYYQSQPGSLAIGEIVLTGGGATLTGLPEELARLLGVPVRLGDPLGRLEVTQPIDETEIGSLAIAVGLGIKD